jgi:hypothetical protein
MMTSIWPFSKACYVNLFLARIFKPEMNAKSILDWFNLRDVGVYLVRPFAKACGILRGAMNVMIDVFKLFGGTEPRVYFERIHIGGKIPKLVGDHVTILRSPLFFSSGHFAALTIGPCLPRGRDRNIFGVERIKVFRRAPSSTWRI